MPRDSNGIYTLPAGNPVISGAVIESNWANTTMPDLGNEITDSLSRNGEGGMLAPLKKVDGTNALPSDTWTTEPTSGWYRAGANDFRFAVATLDVFRIVPGAVEVWNGSSWDAINPGSALLIDGSNFMTGILRVDTADGDHARIGHGRVISGLNQVIYAYSTDGSGATQGTYGAQLSLQGTQAVLQGDAPSTTNVTLTSTNAQINNNDSFLNLLDAVTFLEIGKAGFTHLDLTTAGVMNLYFPGTSASFIFRDSGGFSRGSLFVNDTSDAIEISNFMGAGGFNFNGNSDDCGFGVSPIRLAYSQGPAATDIRLWITDVFCELHATTVGASNLLRMLDSTNLIIIQMGYSSTFGSCVIEVVEDAQDLSILMNLAGAGGVSTEFMRFDATNDQTLIRNNTTGGGNLERALTVSDIPVKLVLSADSTRTLTTTPTAEGDFDQQVSVPANSAIRIRAGLMVSQGGGANGGLSVVYGQANFNYTSLNKYIDTSNLQVSTGSTGTGGETAFTVAPGTLNTGRRIFEIDTILENPTGAPLDVVFEWSQQTLSATATTMFAGSWIEFTSL